MAQKIVVTMTSDISGVEATETVQFGLDGVAYEIDVTEEEATELRENLAAYVGYARKLGRATPTATGRKSSRGGNRDYDPAAVRAWAASNGIDVPARGRFPATVLEQYKAAGN